MANIYEIVTAPAIASYWAVSGQYRQPYFGESKFPNKKQLGIDLSYIKGAKNAPVQLMPSTFDAKVIPISRQGFDKFQYEMPYFKNSMLVNERDRQNLNLVMASGNQAAIDMIARNIFDDESTLLENASLTREAMRMQALTTGVISISANGVKHTYDYHVPTSHKVSPTVKWDVTSADPIADLNAWANMIANEKGVKPTEVLMNSTTLGYIAKTDAVKNAIYVLGQGKVTPSNTEVTAFILRETGLTVYVYDKGYDNNGVFTKFVADGTVVLMPEQNLGSTWFGTTPEESDLMSGATKAEVSIVDTGVAVATYKEEDPVTVTTKVSEICLPSFEMADTVVIASVKTI